MGKALVDQLGYPLSTVLQALDLAHSSFYYRSQKAEAPGLEADMQLVAGQFPTYGTRRMTHVKAGMKSPPIIGINCPLFIERIVPCDPLTIL